MRVILKPAGALLFTGILVTLGVAGFSKRIRANINENAELAPIESLAALHEKTQKTGIFNDRSQMQVVDLTELGKTDWACWGVGDDSVVRKKGRTHELPNFELVQPKSAPVNSGERGLSRGFQWSNGDTKAPASVVYPGVHINGDNGFRLSLPASPDAKKLHLFVGGWKAGADLSAFLSDGTPVETRKEEVALGEGYYSRHYILTFKSSTPKTNLTVTWKKTRGEGNVSLQAAALE